MSAGGEMPQMKPSPSGRIHMPEVSNTSGMSDPSSGARIMNAVRALALIVAGLSALGLLLKLLVVFNQYNMEVLALTVPANLGLLLGVRRKFPKTI